MLSRSRRFVGLACCVLAFALAACQALPLGQPTPTAIARPTHPMVTVAPDFSNAVWARVPFCNCLDGIATDNVSAALKRAQLDATVKLLNPTGGWMYFVVAFDPDTASREQIGDAIKAGGGEVVAGPP